MIGGPFYRGSTRALIRQDVTRTGLMVCQDYKDGTVSIICPKCFCELHASDWDWKCAPGGCEDTRWTGIPTAVGTSVWDPYRFENPDPMTSFKEWVSLWTGIPKEQLSISIEW